MEATSARTVMAMEDHFVHVCQFMEIAVVDEKNLVLTLSISSGNA